MDLTELRRRLRQLSGVRVVSPLAPRTSADASLPSCELEAVMTSSGSAWLHRRTWPLEHRQGRYALGEGLDSSVRTGWSNIAPRCPDLREATFLDVETTSFINSAGTLAFLIGIGYVQDARFVIEQIFLRDPSQEAAMLEFLRQRLERRNWLITFNGRAFDVPLLQSRLLLSGINNIALDDMFHLDLLHVARAVWHGALHSFSLATLERHLLDVRREWFDVPGALIPGLYREYLLQGGGELSLGMQRVLYHNAQDVLSMVALWICLGERAAQPQHPAEHFALGRRYERAGQLDRAEQHYRAALAGAEPRYAALLRRLARLLKRQSRHEEAFNYWQQLADLNDWEGILESARHLDRRCCDPCAALAVARRGLQFATDHARRAALERRVARLERRCERLRS